MRHAMPGTESKDTSRVCGLQNTAPMRQQSEYALVRYQDDTSYTTAGVVMAQRPREVETPLRNRPYLGRQLQWICLDTEVDADAHQFLVRRPRY